MLNFDKLETVGTVKREFTLYLTWNKKSPIKNNAYLNKICFLSDEKIKKDRLC